MYPRRSETTRIQRLALLFVFAYSTTMVWSCVNTRSSCPPGVKHYCKCEKHFSVECNQFIFGNMSVLPCNLKKIVVQGSKLKELQDNIFQLPMLEHLVLPYNKLNTRCIGEDAFKNLTRLMTLDIGYNTEIFKLKKEWFNDLYSLTTFDARNCKIRTIHYNIFENSANLTYVYLANNKLHYLHEGLFKDLAYLKEVDLKGNSLFTLHANAFSGSFELQSIILRLNKFTTFKESFGIQDIDGLVKLDLRGNPIACDCDIRWFHAWLQYTNVTVNASCYCSSNLIGLQVKEFDTNTLHCTIQAWVVVVISVVSLWLLIIFVVLLYRFNIRKIYHRLSLRWHYKQVS
ncbi:protein slit-like isoform X2 [Anneissia japonica]|uniref:protein slit-like isoform X2 n=1 Tax=Anneissia japonica TaxID=1529436 RepID=UPI00142550D1|nr:protein slit-like isoform X2 [Anneissia japonica]